MGCLGEGGGGVISTILYTCISIYSRFSGQFFFKFSQKKIAMGKKYRCAVFGCNNDRLFAEKYALKFSFCPKARVNTERVPVHVLSQFAITIALCNKKAVAICDNCPSHFVIN